MPCRPRPRIQFPLPLQRAHHEPDHFTWRLVTLTKNRRWRGSFAYTRLLCDWAAVRASTAMTLVCVCAAIRAGATWAGAEGGPKHRRIVAAGFATVESYACVARGAGAFHVAAHVTRRARKFALAKIEIGGVYEVTPHDAHFFAKFRWRVCTFVHGGDGHRGVYDRFSRSIPLLHRSLQPYLLARASEGTSFKLAQADSRN